MALWDAFVASPSDWVKQSGYSIGAFVKCLPWLVDDKGWKAASRRYEAEMAKPIEGDLLELMGKVVKCGDSGKSPLK